MHITQKKIHHTMFIEAAQKVLLGRSMSSEGPKE